MATRVLEAPRYPQLNLRIYQDNGSLLAGKSRFIGAPDGTPGAALRLNGRASVGTGDYIVLDKDQSPIIIDLTTNCAPRRIRTLDTNTPSQGQSERNQLQRTFRDSLRNRDTYCAITGPPRVINHESPFQGLEATHVFPVSLISEWKQDNYEQYITDPSPSNDVGESRLYSAQNGLLLSTDIHILFDAFTIGVDPDSGYKIIVFATDNVRMGGTCLKDSARSGPQHVSADLLRWHLRMCLYRNMKANAEPWTQWEEDLGEDPMGEITRQPDAAERMEVELFTRLGGLIA
ncbi:hypothetical protein PITC_015400 [Penicillium italicum]|uniref:HNH nuclease domain-containing protein n=1 Tax=Penicillium italicum TaxID=40296 RepID=A0A0A2KRP6_PENIT|nr:hypothetical protein PITC_015400 [Penicillium italicum]